MQNSLSMYNISMDSELRVINKNRLIKMNTMRIFILFFIIVGFYSHLSAQDDIPRPEHPKPQFIRENWKNLNGSWNFYIDFDQSGLEREFFNDFSVYDKKINVPFPPESELSGIAHKGFMPVVWYHRPFQIPADWDQRIFLHFGAVDYEARVWINGKEVGRHYGGSVSFCFDITEAVQEGINELVVMAKDDIRSGIQPGGKQSKGYYNDGCCMYTRTTGIWQTVWLEARPESYIENIKITPDPDNSRFVLIPTIKNMTNGQKMTARLLNHKKKLVAEGVGYASGLPLVLNVEDPVLWCPQNPYLYDLELVLSDQDKSIDEVFSYAGMRKIHISGNKIFLNNEPVFLRFVLDQGFYPEGVWTAPTDEALKRDIELAMAVGFNGARLHEKIFEERFHYWADKLGYLTWAEFPDWGISRTYNNPRAWLNLTREWREEIIRDYNHPSIIAWTPLNETHSAKDDYEAYRRAAEEIAEMTRMLDPTRPVNNASGYLHIDTDLLTVHDYTMDPQIFAERYQKIAPGEKDMYIVDWDWYGKVSEYQYEYDGKPYLVDEYGGIYWLPDYAGQEERGNARDTWGYGKSAEEVLSLMKKLTRALVANPNISGYTYTQLTDVEQETNGIYTFDRQLKFNRQELQEIFGVSSLMESAKFEK